MKKTLKDYCRNHNTKYGFDNPVAREASCLGHLESWVEQAVKEYENSSQNRKLVEQKKDELKSLINHGATDAAIGAELGMTVSRVRYWIKEWNLGRRKHIITTGRFR